MTDDHDDVQALFDAQGLVNSLDRDEYPSNVQAAIDRASEAVEDAAIEVQLYREGE